jgi:hypothetical protein
MEMIQSRHFSSKPSEEKYQGKEIHPVMRRKPWLGVALAKSAVTYYLFWQQGREICLVDRLKWFCRAAVQQLIHHIDNMSDKKPAQPSVQVCFDTVNIEGKKSRRID